MSEDTPKDRRPLFLAIFLGIIVVIVLAIVIPRIGGDDDGDSGSTVTKNGCEVPPKPKPKQVNLQEPPQTVKPGDKLTAVVDTSCGTFDIALDTTQAPVTTNSFAYLAKKGVYDDTLWHRIIPGFMDQGGDPQGTGSGGPGYSVTEAPPSNLKYTPGVVAMAKTGTEPPGTSGSQFFVVAGTSSPLPPDYALVGTVSKGMDVVMKINKLGTSSAAGTPKQVAVINSVKIEEG
jgi:peptidyl-prolyl cis-trans isomerase B (cyclophilin B)